MQWEIDERQTAAAGDPALTVWQPKEVIPGDKRTWGNGPWVGEPDRIEWLDARTSYPCLMVRNTSSSGSWCGYVAVPPGHPAHGKSHNDLDNNVQVHGGVTHTGLCQQHICHEPAQGEPDNVWWVGFDTAHCDDYMPLMMAKYSMEDCMPGPGAYKDERFVKVQCAMLATQLRTLEEAGSMLAEVAT